MPGSIVTASLKTALAAFAVALIFLLPAGPVRAQEFRLLMVEQVGCYVCGMFNREVAPAYEASPEGQIAPLIHTDLRAPLPEGVTLNSRPFVTPTFVLLDADGTEVGRLIGYPGDDFFWPFVNEMIENARSIPAG